MRFKPPHECNLEKLENVSCCCYWVLWLVQTLPCSSVEFLNGLGNEASCNPYPSLAGQTLSNSQRQLLSSIIQYWRQLALRNGKCLAWRVAGFESSYTLTSLMSQTLAWVAFSNTVLLYWSWDEPLTSPLAYPGSPDSAISRGRSSRTGGGKWVWPQVEGGGEEEEAGVCSQES